MRRDCDVLIVGGGLNGATLALALASAGVSVALIDAGTHALYSDPEFDGRAYALSASSRRMLTALGIWSRVAAETQVIAGIKISDGRAGEGAAPWYLRFDGGEIDEGPMGHMLEDRYLRRALIEALGAAGVETREGARVVAQEVRAGGVVVTLESGETLSGALLVGADGRDSGVARRAGLRRGGHDYRQTALVCAIAHERPHGGVAHQFFMPAGPLAILPLPGNRSSIVWTERRGAAEAIQALAPEGYLAALRPRFGDFLGEIGLAGRRFSYPLGLTLAEDIAAPRLALVGDAAHGIHPLAGQGLNLGLRDVASLAEVLAVARRRGLDLGAADVLDGYRAWRRVDTALLVTATDGINRLFSNDNPLLRLGRDLGLGLVNGMGPLRRGLIREAAGLTGDLPLLLRGRPL